MLPSRQMRPDEQRVLSLVLLPGTLCDERLFAPLLEGLRDLTEPIKWAPHILQTGGCATIRAMAERVLAAAPKHFALLGFSLGGIVALEVALLAPERVLGLALLDVNAAPVPLTHHAARREAVEQARLVGHGRYLREQMWTSYVGPACRENLKLQQLLASMAQELGPEVFSNQTEAAIGRRDLRPLLPTLSMPTLILAGEHDAVCPAAVQKEFAAAIPNVSFTLIPDAGHFALLEQRDAVAASVAAWLHTTAGVHVYRPGDPKETT